MKHTQQSTQLDWQPGSERACLETQDKLLLAMSIVTINTSGDPVSCCEPTMFVTDLSPIHAHRLILKHFWAGGHSTTLA